jgi:hypothetical protein
MAGIAEAVRLEDLANIVMTEVLDLSDHEREEIYRALHERAQHLRKEVK